MLFGTLIAVIFAFMAPSFCLAGSGAVWPMSSLHFAWTTNSTHFVATLTATNMGSAIDGYIALGLAEPNGGSMQGSDMAIASWSPTTGALTVQDYFASARALPSLDCTSQDWVAVSSSRNGTASTAVIARTLSVSDTAEDRAIFAPATGAATRMVFATGAMRAAGASETAHTEGRIPMYHGTSRVLGAYDLFATTNTEAFLRANYQSVKVGMTNFPLFPIVTTYAGSACVPATAFPADARQVAFKVGTDSPSSQPYVHHLLLFGVTNCSAWTAGMWTTTADAAYPYRAIVWGAAQAWDPFVLPTGVGFPARKYGGYAVEFHYDNPNRLSGILDSTYVEVFHTADQTGITHDAGTFELGDPAAVTPTTIPANTYTSATYRCPASATANWGDITVFGELVHMHGHGSHFQTTVTAPDGSQSTLGKSEYYSFDAQMSQLMTDTVVKAGSQLDTRCVFRNTQSSDVKFGLESADEMCIHFIYYYPASSSIYKWCGFGASGSYLGNASSTTNTFYTNEFGQACALRGVSGASAVAFAIGATVCVLLAALF